MERLILRELTEADVEDLRKWLGLDEVYTYWGRAASKGEKNPELLFIDPRPNVNRMPYCSLDHDGMSDWVEYGHTMEDYIGGQIECGLVINGYVECQLEDITELHFLTRAVKMA